jgi:hypothetical protein
MSNHCFYFMHVSLRNRISALQLLTFSSSSDRIFIKFSIRDTTSFVGGQQAEANGNAGGEQKETAMDAQPSGQEGSSAATNNVPTEVDLASMTEEEQLEWALRMSMVNEAEEKLIAGGSFKWVQK